MTSTGGSGGSADLAAVDADALIEVPHGVELDTAVALLADGRTAMMRVHAAALRDRERALVEAAAGGVGTLLVQLARAADARIVAAAGSAHKVDIARQLGAELGVNYGAAGWAEQMRETMGGVDVVFDGVGGTSRGPPWARRC